MKGVIHMKDIIMQRLGMGEAEAELMAQDLSNVCKALKPLVEAWLETGAEEDDTLYQGYSINSLKRDYGMYFTGAVLTLDWLLQEPEKAKAALTIGVM